MNDKGDQAAQQPNRGAITSNGLFRLVITVFFLMGGIVSLNDLITPKLKSLFALNYTEGMFINVCFFMAYGCVSIPAAQLVKSVGYLRSIAIGLIVMGIGSLLFILATTFVKLPVFLLASFVLASGHVIVQVSLNPLASLLGSPAKTNTRLTLAQAFNSLGMVTFPAIFGALIFGSFSEIPGGASHVVELDQSRWSESRSMVFVYTLVTAALAAITVMVWASRNQLQGERHARGSIRDSLELFQTVNFTCGAFCISLYVGSEIALASVLVNYIQLPWVLGISAAEAASFTSFYWGAALLGRFVGAALLARIAPGMALCTAGLGALLLIVISANSTGIVAALSFVAIGLMNAIMFPTIFSLACKGLGDRAAEGSGFINLAICGGAIVTLSTGRVADMTGNLTIGLVVPALCYCAITSFGWFNRGRQLMP